MDRQSAPKDEADRIEPAFPAFDDQDAGGDEPATSAGDAAVITAQMVGGPPGTLGGGATVAAESQSQAARDAEPDRDP
jgi:hypothetical protein